MKFSTAIVRALEELKIFDAGETWKVSFENSALPTKYRPFDKMLLLRYKNNREILLVS